MPLCFIHSCPLREGGGCTCRSVSTFPAAWCSVNSIPDRCTGSFARADQRRDVCGYAREGVAAAFPGLVLVVAGNEVNAKVADGKLGDVLGHAEPAHQGAAGRRGACRRSADCFSMLSNAKILLLAQHVMGVTFFVSSPNFFADA